MWIHWRRWIWGREWKCLCRKIVQYLSPPSIFLPLLYGCHSPPPPPSLSSIPLYPLYLPSLSLYLQISVPTSQVLSFTDSLLLNDDVKLAGLGARDICRMEAGLCLYGNDISEETTPIEAGLAWCISKWSVCIYIQYWITDILFVKGKRRRAEGGFIGEDNILKQLKKKPQQKRIGLIMSGGGAPARSNTVY